MNLVDALVCCWKSLHHLLKIGSCVLWQLLVSCGRLSSQSSRECVGIDEMLPSNVRDAEVVLHHSQTESLHSDGQLIKVLGTEERDERLMVCFDLESQTNEVGGEMFACPGKHKCFFLYLTVMLLGGCHRRRKTRTLISINPTSERLLAI